MSTAEWKGFFKGKKVTQLGLGLLGRGVRDAAFFAKHGAILTVTDMKGEADLGASLKKLGRYRSSIRFVLGRHDFLDFREADLVVKAAGVPLDSPYIAEARSHGIPVEMDASLFAKLAPQGVVLVGVTGTRGKTTTATLISEILKADGRRTFLAGNVRDTATLPLLEEVRSGDTIVLELDSWQLQGFGDAEISPRVAVFTTFMEDHMNYYKGDMEAYFRDKSNIFRFQKPGDSLIVGEQARSAVLAASPPVPPVVARSSDIPSAMKLNLIGEHARANVACAIAAARALQVPEGAISKAVGRFRGVEGRLTLVRRIRGVAFYNDTTATTPAAASAALAALVSRGGKAVIIVGGSDKGLDPSPLADAIRRSAAAAVILPGTGTDRLRPLLASAGIPCTEVSSMEDAVAAARKLSVHGGAVVLSPGFASFGLFKNEYDRGDSFVRAVKSLR